MIEKGLPSFYITINPEVSRWLRIDINAFLPEDIPDYWDQSVLLAKNPVVAARFFNLYIEAFISPFLQKR
jgi:hypothetical protein